MDDRRAYLELIADLASRFISVPLDRVDPEVERALADIGRVVHADRAYLIQREGPDEPLRCSHEWCREHVRPTLERLQPVGDTTFPWISSELDAGRAVNVPDVRTMTQGQPEEWALLREHGVRAVLISPLIVNGERIGAVGFDMSESPRVWSSDTELLLSLIGKMMLGLFERQQADRSLLASQQRYRDLVENSVETILVLDADRNQIIDANENVRQLFGVDRESILRADPERFLPPAQPDGASSLEKAVQVIRRCLDGERVVMDWLYRDIHGRDIPCEVRAVPLPAGEGRRIRLSILDVRERKQREQEQLAYLRRTREQHLRLGQVATNPALADGDLQTLYADATAAAQGVLDTARASIWFFNSGHDALHCVCLRGASGEVEEEHGLLRVEDNQAYLAGMSSRRALAVSDANTDTRVTGMRERYLRPRGVQALVDAPIRVSGRLVGTFSVEHVDGPRAWQVDEIEFVGAVADQIAQALINHDRALTVAALRESEQRYRALYDDTPSLFFTVDEAGFVQSVNRFAANSLGYAIEDLVGLPFDVLHDHALAVTVDAQIRACIETPGEVRRWDSRLARRDGGSIWVRISARAQSDVNGDVQILVVCEDITEARKLSEELRYQARHDALTGLCNRREFESRLESVLERGGEHVLCYLDLDQFKIINDTCGHMAGDELLRQLSTMLRGKLGQWDLLARLGGDEFGVLFENQPLEHARVRADQLRLAISEFHFSWGGREFGLGVSIGLVPIEEGVGSLHEVMSVADTACYAAKDQGRNRIHVYRKNDAELARRHGEMEWVSAIREALSRDRFELHYQPITRLAENDGELHYELLLRMVDAKGKLVMPDSFLPAAERFNMTPALDRWVIRTALSWLEARPAHLQRLHTCAINLSGLSLGEEEFLDWTLQCFRESSVPPDRICFEITETAAIRNLTVATGFMTRLGRLGCRFALDDFGSGLSSFGYLKNLPVDSIKIDGVFVRDMLQDPINHAVVKSINEIGHVMGKMTVAEFVEDDETLDALREIGVDYAQGFGIARPAPLSDMDVEEDR